MKAFRVLEKEEQRVCVQEGEGPAEDGEGYIQLDSNEKVAREFTAGGSLSGSAQGMSNVARTPFIKPEASCRPFAHLTSFPVHWQHRSRCPRHSTELWTDSFQ